jgi:hypothetical protein
MDSYHQFFVSKSFINFFALFTLTYLSKLLTFPNILLMESILSKFHDYTLFEASNIIFKHIIPQFIYFIIIIVYKHFEKFA